jgi:hypothetical protein
MLMANPFTVKVIKREVSFFNRTEELKDLAAYAKNKTNVLLFSPRRYGKTSLVKMVQKKISQDNFLTVYVDLFGLTSIDDIANRIAKAVYNVIHQQKTLMRKALTVFMSFRPVMRPTEKGVSISVEPMTQTLFGIDLLDKTMEDIGTFIEQSRKKIHVVFDEFQEITELRTPQIEGVLRKHIQEQPVSYFFVGSRRRILLDMFTDRRRPFFQSAISYRLKKIPHDEFTRFICDGFARAKKDCSLKVASGLAKKVSNHPYYVQKLALLTFEVSQKKVTSADAETAFNLLLEDERVLYEAILQGLAPKQIALIRALAKEPSQSVLSSQYMKQHDLKSIGGVQAALKKLSQLDLIEKARDKCWCVVDPVFSNWLAQ